MSTLKVNILDSYTGSTVTVDSTSDLVVTSTASATDNTSGALRVSGGISTQENLYVGGNAVITGTMTANGGTITLGDAGTDNVTIGGEINSDVIPDVTNTYDLGSSSKKWAEIHATTFTGALTGNVTGNTSGSAGSCTGNSATATALATGRTVGMTGDVVWTSAALDGTGNVTGTAAIQSDTVAATELGVTAGTATALKALVVDASKDINLGTGDLTATVITGALTGNASTASAWATARTLELTGAVTGSASVDGSGNVSMATTATADPTITLAGDLSGAVTLTNLGNGTLTATVADDSHNHVIGNVDGLQAALDLKATLASPTLTGAPIAPTAAANTNTTQIATTAYVQTELTDLIGGAPGTLDTLNELAAAINDDASYASTLTTALGTKTAKTSNQSLSSAANAMTISGHTITLNRGDSTTDTVTVPDNNTTYSVGDGGLTQVNFTTADNTKLDGIEAGANVTDTANVTAAGALMDSEVTNLAQVKAFDTTDYATSTQGTTADNALPKAGGTMTGTISSFTSTGIDDNATSTKLAVSNTGIEVTGSIKMGDDTRTAAAAGAGTFRFNNNNIEISNGDDWVGLSVQGNAPNGMHYYNIPHSTAGILEHYALSSPFDLVNKGNVYSSLNVGFRIDVLDISSDGKTLWLLGDTPDNIYTYNLTTPYDLSSAILVSTQAFWFNADPPTCFEIINNGTKLFIEDFNGALIQYSLNPAYDLSSRVQTGSLTGFPQSGPGDPAFSQDGSKVVFGQRGGYTIRGGTLSSPFDISTYTETHTFITPDGDPSCAKWNADGTLLFVRHASPDMVNEYTTSTPYTLNGMAFSRQIYNNPAFAGGGHEFNYGY